MSVCGAESVLRPASLRRPICRHGAVSRTGAECRPVAAAAGVARRALGRPPSAAPGRTGSERPGGRSGTGGDDRPSSPAAISGAGARWAPRLGPPPGRRTVPIVADGRATAGADSRRHEG